MTSPIINMACHKECTYVSVDRLVEWSTEGYPENKSGLRAADIVMHEHEKLD